VSERISVAFAIPGDLATPTGGYVYDRRVLERLADHGIDAAVLPLPGSFPDPSPADLAAARAALEAVPAGRVLLIDGLAWGAFPAAMAGGIAAPLVALCHHPLGVETGLSPERARQLIDNETATLALARRIVVTSPATKAVLVADFGAPADRIDVAEPGAARARKRRAWPVDPRGGRGDAAQGLRRSRRGARRLRGARLAPDDRGPAGPGAGGRRGAAIAMRTGGPH